MNEQKILELADFLDSIPIHRFNINSWTSVFDSNYCDVLSKEYSQDFKATFIERNEVLYGLATTLDVNICNTAGCIAGWALALDNGGTVEITKSYSSHDVDFVVTRGAISLGLTFAQARRLFFSDNVDSVWVEEISKYLHILDEYSYQRVVDQVNFYDEDYDIALSEMFRDNEIVITNSVAAYVLRCIAKGSISL